MFDTRIYYKSLCLLTCIYTDSKDEFARAYRIGTGAVNEVNKITWNMWQMVNGSKYQSQSKSARERALYITQQKKFTSFEICEKYNVGLRTVKYDIIRLRSTGWDIVYDKREKMYNNKGFKGAENEQ